MLDFWIGRTRVEAVGAVKCTAPHGKRSRGVYTRLHLLQLIVGRATPTLSATLRCGGALASARQLLPPPARRAHARLHHKGHRQKSP